MAAVIQVAGLASVRLGAGAGNLLGYTRNGVEITHDGFYLDVPGDANGGDDGPPIDIQKLGQIDRVRCELTKWDQAQADIVRSRIGTGGSAGTVPTTGALMFAAGLCFELFISVTSVVIPSFRYKYAFPRSAIEENRGTKFSTFVFEFECHMNSSDRIIYTQG